MTLAARTKTEMEPRERVLVMTRQFDAPRSRLFQIWTDPEHIVRWWGPRGFTMPSHKIDVRPGGAYRVCMRSAEGTNHWLRGIYREIVEPERLAFTFTWENAEGRPGHETLVTVTFVEQGGKTELTLHQAIFESVTARDAHQSGWASNLDRLAGYLETI